MQAMNKKSNLDDYRHNLVDKILHSGSYEEVKRYLLTAIYSLEKHKVNGHLVERFIEKTLGQLEGLSLLNMDAKSLMNVRFAKMQLENIKTNRCKIKVGNVQT
jgi:hypothetical protein